MILKAHVGVGIMGKEGNQASTYADYSIVKYKDLRRLLFWHGRGFAWRLSFAMKMCIFKNTVFSIPLFFMNAWAGMSSSLAMEDMFRALYLIFLTMDTYVFYIFFEKDISFHKYGPSDAKFPDRTPEDT